MTRGAGLSLACVLIAFSANAADADPKFTAEAGPNSVAVYSTAAQAATCSVILDYSFMYRGERRQTMQYCNNVPIKAGKHVLTCEANNPQLVDVKVEGPVQVKCGK